MNLQEFQALKVGDKVNYVSNSDVNFKKTLVVDEIIDEIFIVFRDVNDDNFHFSFSLYDGDVEEDGHCYTLSN